MAPLVDLSATQVRVEALIDAAALRTPAAPAIIFHDECWSYDRLIARADAIAEALSARGVKKGSIVGVSMRRSPELVAAFIGVMKSGGAYLPLDPSFPEHRLRYMVEDSGAQLILVDDVAAGASLAASTELLAMRTVASRAAQVVETGASSDDLAYLIYTSGSTGRPKGVEITHQSLANFLLSMAVEPGLAADDRLLAVTTSSFDIAGLEFFLPLVVGAAVVLADEDDVTDGGRLIALMIRHRVSAMQATPTGWRLLAEAGWRGGSGFKALVGGEALPPDLARSLAGSCGEVWNLYGPTETTIWSTAYRLPPSGEPVLIGAPIANTGVYVLDRHGAIQPPGVQGEIYIGGAGVARGYRNQVALSAERFMPDPFIPEFGGRMYRTGDLGRYDRDGLVEYRGRADSQVKLRGHRIELGEIESVFAEVDAVRAAAAKIVGTDDLARLAVFVEASAGADLDVTTLRDHARARLAPYMIPQHVVILDRLPLTPNGKIDRARLPDPINGSTVEPDYVEPATPTERLVADAFSEALGVSRVGATANFFELGGHSILAIRALAILRREFSPYIELRTLFDAGDVREFARRLDAMSGVAAASATQEYEF